MILPQPRGKRADEKQDKIIIEKHLYIKNKIKREDGGSSGKDARLTGKQV